VRALRRAGVAPIDVAVVHAVFAPGALQRARAAGARYVVSCDTIPHPSNAIAVAPLVAAAAESTLTRRRRRTPDHASSARPSARSSAAMSVSATTGLSSRGWPRRGSGSMSRSA